MSEFDRGGFRLEDRPLKDTSVAIVGGSVSGLLVARAFENAGADVQVFERTGSNREPRGGALVIRPEGHAAMKQLGISLPHGTLITRRHQYLWGGTFERAWENNAYTWSGLTGAFRKHISEESYQAGQIVTGVTPSSSEPSIHISEKLSVSADLVVIADGTGSRARQSVAPNDPTPEYAGYVAYRGEIPWEIIPSSQKEKFSNTLYEIGNSWGGFNSFPINEDLSGDEQGKQRLTWTLVHRQTFEEVKQLFGPQYAKSGLLPPGQITTDCREYIESLANEHLPSYCKDLPSIVRNSDVMFARAIQDLPNQVMPGNIVFDRVAVVGDAAYPARPLSGRSTSKAAVDAVTLASHLSVARQEDKDLQAGLATWQQERLPDLHKVANRGRELDWRFGLPPYDPKGS